MEFRIADTFTDALARLPAQDQKAVKTSAFDLQMNPVSTGLQFHRIDKSKDKNFWSVRVNRDIRIIVHKTPDSMLLAYVDHHDKAYQWAERRRIEAHPKTGVMQIVPVRELVAEIAPQLPFEPVLPAEAPKPATTSLPCFGKLTGEQLLSVGVPIDWVSDVLSADEDRFLAIADHLPSEASEALLEYVATGALPVQKPAPVEEPYAHPDAMRRFRLVENAEELRLALEYPWDKWMVYLHPSQREIIAKDFSGPARVAGSAGTGKTVVALHRALRLARSTHDARVLLTTFSQPLADMLERKLAILGGDDRSALGRITVTPFHGVAEQLYELAFGRRPHIAADSIVRSSLAKAAEEHGISDIPLRFLVSEWSNVIDAWQLAAEDAYATVPRLGRKNRLSAKQRARLWPIFHAVQRGLAQKGIMTWAQVCAELAAQNLDKSAAKPFTNIVVDETQDLGVPELRLLRAIAPNTPNSLFFAGDLGQRIFQQPFSWLGLGVDVRGRSQLLKVNYRTSHQIREAADRLLPKTLRDVDGLEDRRVGTVSAFNGPEPKVERFKTTAAEAQAVGHWIKQALDDGFATSEIGVFVRDHDQLDRARAAVKAAGATPLVFSERGVSANDRIAIGTMHLAKGLEFKAVAVMACDDEIIPLQARVEAVADEVDLDDVYETERQLLYVACTRARDRLLVTCILPGSDFLNDFAEM
jgi:superfamily I DNA/RNA helicase